MMDCEAARHTHDERKNFITPLFGDEPNFDRGRAALLFAKSPRLMARLLRRMRMFAVWSRRRLECKKSRVPLQPSHMGSMEPYRQTV